MNIHQKTAEPALMSLTSVAQAIAQKRLSSREVTQSCLGRIAQWQPRLNAFMAIEAEAALAAAGAQGYVLRRGQGGHLRIENPPRFRRHHDLDRPAAPEGCRHDPAGLAADVGIRLWPDRSQRALRAGQ